MFVAAQKMCCVSSVGFMLQNECFLNVPQRPDASSFQSPTEPDNLDMLAAAQKMFCPGSSGFFRISTVCSKLQNECFYE